MRISAEEKCGVKHSHDILDRRINEKFNRRLVDSFLNPQLNKYYEK